MRQGRAEENAAHGVANDGVRAGIGEALQPSDQTCDNSVVSLGHCRVPELPGAIAPSAKLANQEKERKRRPPKPVDEKQVHSSILHQHHPSLHLDDAGYYILDYSPLHPGENAKSAGDSMSDRATELARKLGLAPHPEGGLYREVYRSESSVYPADGRGSRPAITGIYFLLPAGAVSRWHRVQSDELWHFYEGAPLELWVATPSGDRIGQHLLGPCSDTVQPMQTVRAGWWQAARSTGGYTLVGCTVGPGFEFSDFVLAADIPSAAAMFRSHDAATGDLL
jgi:uncharacterized protein